DQLGDPRLEAFLALELRGLDGSEARCGVAVGVAFPHHFVELQTEVANGLLRTRRLAAAEQPSNQRSNSERDQPNHDNGRIHETAPPREQKANFTAISLCSQ